jgi:hypothetical protein
MVSGSETGAAALTALHNAPSVMSMKIPQPIRLQHEIESREKELERTSEDQKLEKLKARAQAATQHQQRLFAQAS